MAKLILGSEILDSAEPEHVDSDLLVNCEPTSRVLTIAEAWKKAHDELSAGYVLDLHPAHVAERCVCLATGVQGRPSG